jgi:methionyl-tRNA formyltransferase
MPAMNKVVFMGTPDFSVPSLQALIETQNVVGVVTQPDKPAGRGQQLTPSPVKVLAQAAGIPVYQPKSLRTEAAAEPLRQWAPDVIVVAAFGQILRPHVLDLPPHGCLNVHASLLPRWRGAAPIQRAIMAGDGETGVCIMRMDEGLDTGPVCLMERVAIGPDETAGALHDRLAAIGADLMVRALAALSRGGLDARPQADDGVTYAAKIDKAEAHIDWSRPAAVLHDHVRGLSPFPGAWFAGPDGRTRVKVLRAEQGRGEGPPGTVLDDALTVACGDGALRLIEVQREGKGVMIAADLLRGFPVPPGTVLG